MKKQKILSLALVFCLLFALTACGAAGDYDAAAKLMEEGKYAEAKDAFTALGDYKDSADKAAECEYQFTTAYVTDALVGEWSSDELDISKLMTDSILAAVEGNEESQAMLDKMDLSFYTGKLCYRFTENGTLVAFQDAELGAQNLEKLFDELGRAAEEYMLDILKAGFEEEGITMEQARAELGAADDAELVKIICEEALGINMSDFVSEMIPMDALKNALDQKQPGVFTVSGNEVTLTVGEDSVVYTYDMENDTLIGDDADLGLTGIVFTKLG